LLEIGSFPLGFFIGPRLEFSCELAVERRWFEASEDREHDGPQIGRLLEGTGKESLCSVSEVEVGFVNEEDMEGIKILEFVWVEQAARIFFDTPEFNLLGCRIFLETVEKSVVSEQVLGVLDELGDELPDSTKAW